MLENKRDFLESLTEEQLNSGYGRLRIVDDIGAERIWCLVYPEDRKKYNDDSCFDEITVILCNYPLAYQDLLEYGTEVVVKCCGEKCPVLTEEFLKAQIEYKEDGTKYVRAVIA